MLDCLAGKGPPWELALALLLVLQRLLALLLLMSSIPVLLLLLVPLLVPVSSLLGPSWLLRNTAPTC